MESIRGIAALLVVLHHFFEWSPLNEIALIKNSYLMVDLFFVLSGFVIFNAYTNKIYSSKDLIRFQFLRFGRLYPVHFILIMLYLVLEIAKYMASLKLQTPDIRAIPFSQNNFSAFIQNICLIQALGPLGMVEKFNGPAWSISVEFYTYLIFACIVLYFNRFKIYFFSVIATSAVALLAVNSTFDSGGSLRCLAGFFAGCLTAQYIKITTIKLSYYIQIFTGFALILFLQFKPIYVQNNTIYSDVTVYLLTALLIASLVLNQNGYLNKFLKRKIFVWLGTISYSLYMSHTFLLVMVENFFKRVLHRPDIQLDDGTWVPSVSAQDSIIALIATLILTLIVSHFLYHYVEKPMREKSRQFAFNHLM